MLSTPRRAAVAVTAAIGAIALLASCATSQSGSGSAARAVDATVPATTSAPAAPAAPVTVPSVPAPSTTPPAAAVPVAVNHCAGNTVSQLVKVSISAQHLWLCHYTTVALDTPITSGASSLPYDSTPTGTFHIQGRDRNTVLTLNTGKQYNVKYWIPFSAPLFGFHDSSWQDFPYGSSQYKTDGSHGCVHMPLQAIAFFYNWVHVGATVQIHA